MHFGILTHNPILDCGLLAWFLAQTIKVLLDGILLRKLDLRRFFTSGGMPSSHSALVTSCAVGIGKLYGVGSPLFALAAVMAVIVMYDACNVRRSAGDTARLVNKLLAHMEAASAEEIADNIREVMGHTPLQVFAGAVLGLCLGLLV